MTVSIGSGGLNVPEDRGYAFVLCYTVANATSRGGVQRRHGGQWFKGKNFDSHCPLGPWIVTSDELGDPHNLHISLRVNGVVKQDSNTRFMVFRMPRIIKELSTGVVLEAGDV